MELKLSTEERKKLLAFLESDEDCERLPGNEFVADLYEAETPLTLNLLLNGEKVELLAAAQLLYDAELDAYYMGDPVEDVEAVTRALLRATEGNGRHERT